MIWVWLALRIVAYVLALVVSSLFMWLLVGHYVERTPE